jgi:hypothetical protein
MARPCPGEQKPCLCTEFGRLEIERGSNVEFNSREVSEADRGKVNFVVRNGTGSVTI